ncbi:MAG: hypothetical protein ABIG29_00405 [Candidatus Nealsonbacteria bacterium]
MIGIIPKPIKKTSKLYGFSPYIVFGLVLAVVLAYVVLFYLGNKASETSSDLEEKIAQVGTKEEKVLETQVLIDKQRIDDFSKIFSDHQRFSNFFKFLEENCHPKIWFNKLELNSQDSQAVLTGETSNFETLGQQMVIFQNQTLVKTVEITNIAIGNTGRVDFTLSLLLDPEIFKTNEPR